MKKSVFIASFLLFSVFAATIFSIEKEFVRESIIFFPIEPHVNYKVAKTMLTLLNQSQRPPYKIRWDTVSELDQTAYLRQDVSLLFSNGRLVDTMGLWKTNVAALVQEKLVSAKESSLFEAITFHYSELHNKKGIPSSAQTMSSDRLFVIAPSGKSVFSADQASNTQIKEWKRKLEQKTLNITEASWNKGLRFFSINPDQYESFPLTSFLYKGKKALPGYSIAATNRIVGNMWEGLYKNYFLGIKKRNGTILKPTGSTIPIIMIAKNRSHLLLLFETADGEPIILKQIIESTP